MKSKPEKERRMEVRRELGNRRIGGGNYVPPSPDLPGQRFSHACFDCRKSYKLAYVEGAERTCPQCAGPAHLMGRHFQAPPARDLREWRKVQILYAEGYRFSGSGGTHYGPTLPERLSALAEFLRDNPEHPLRYGERRPDLFPDGWATE